MIDQTGRRRIWDDLASFLACFEGRLPAEYKRRERLSKGALAPSRRKLLESRGATFSNALRQAAVPQRW